MSFEQNRKSFMDSLFGISTMLKRWHTEIQKKDVDKNYMIENKYTDHLYIMGRSLGSCSAFEIIDNFVGVESDIEYTALHFVNLAPSL